MNALRLALIVAVLSFQSCIYSKMTHLSDKDLEWVDVYEVGDTVLFVSNHGNTDIMTVNRRSLYNDRCPFYISTGSGPDYKANAGYHYEIQHQRNILDGLISFQKNMADTLDVLYFLGMQFSLSDTGKRSNYVPLEIRKFKNKYGLYDNCIIADSTNSEYSDYWKKRIKPNVEKFVWSKEYGLIYYKFEDGEEFFLKNLLPDSVRLGLLSATAITINAPVATQSDSE